MVCNINVGSLDNASSGRNGIYGMDWLDVITIIGIFMMFAQVLITTSPISRSKTPLIRNSLAFLEISWLVPQRNWLVSQLSLVISSTNSCLEAKVASSSSGGSCINFSWLVMISSSLALFLNCLITLRKAQSPSFCTSSTHKSG